MATTNRSLPDSAQDAPTDELPPRWAGGLAAYDDAAVMRIVAANATARQAVETGVAAFYRPHAEMTEIIEAGIWLLEQRRRGLGPARIRLSTIDPDWFPRRVKV